MHWSPQLIPLTRLVPQQPHFLPQELGADRRDVWASLQALPPPICQVVTAASAQNHLEARAGSGPRSGPPVAASCTPGAPGPSQWPQLGAGGTVCCAPGTSLLLPVLTPRSSLAAGGRGSPPHPPTAAGGTAVEPRQVQAGVGIFLLSLKTTKYHSLCLRLQ